MPVGCRVVGADSEDDSGPAGGSTAGRPFEQDEVDAKERPYIKLHYIGLQQEQQQQ